MSFMALIPPDSSDRLSINSQYIAIPERSSLVFSMQVRHLRSRREVQVDSDWGKCVCQWLASSAEA
ncbi:AP-2 complex subunit alpha-2-like [Dorcoceras hygrometricum]|uniref:AP-2 complex subunit alpha-2-like n=1 Tax=Dorcoceras hygrometricum TaxID=472368 RepID=A0A2Z7C4M6_9LAMI|nr:AP-2 complex subunit alpha-2-like [Dorcoceras hygrometricum]